MPAPDKKTSANYSNSIFSEQPGHSLDTAKQAADQERRKRLRTFRRIGLPLCLLGIVSIGFLLRKPITAIVTFKEPDYEAIQREMAEQENIGHDQEPSEESKLAIEKAKKRYGNQEAEIIISLRFPDELFAPEGILALAYNAIDCKPSEIGLIVEFRQPISGEQGENSILINGKSEVTSTINAQTRTIQLNDSIREEDFALVLDNLHAALYGPCAHPLKVKIGQELQEKRRQREAAALPKIVPAPSAAANPEVPPGKTLVLPTFKAETSVLPLK